LTSAVSEEQLKEFREHERTGRVLGDDDFQKRLENQLAWIPTASIRLTYSSCNG